MFYPKVLNYPNNLNLRYGNGESCDNLILSPVIVIALVYCSSVTIFEGYNPYAIEPVRSKYSYFI